MLVKPCTLDCYKPARPARYFLQIVSHRKYTGRADSLIPNPNVPFFEDLIDKICILTLSFRIIHSETSTLCIPPQHIDQTVAEATLSVPPQRHPLPLLP